MTELLSVRDLSFQISGRKLLDAINFAGRAGEVLAIVGPNGAGKSTLLRMLSGETRPTEGTVSIGGEMIGSVPQRRLAARRAVMLQNSRVVFPFTAFEVVRLGTEGIGVGLSRKSRDELAFAALERADAAAFAERNFMTLSGGEQQRVSFARALAQLSAGQTLESSQILLLDEPTASLDVRHQLSLLEYTQLLVRDNAILAIVVLHDLALAHTFADKILVLQNGRLATIATRAEPLSRELIERIFEVSIAAEHCHGTPWRALDNSQKPDAVVEPKAPRAAVSI